MIALISFFLTIVGCVNWFLIGVLQYDFVAGLFGSQASIFSRIIYFIIGIASIVVLVNFISNKGKFVISFKDAKEDMNEMTSSKKTTPRRRKLSTATESSKDYSMNTKSNNDSQYKTNNDSTNDHNTN